MRLIDADVLKKDLTRFYDNEVTAKRLIDEQPTIEPERKKGRWLDGYKRQTCSLCKGKGVRSWNYCPYCGADMIGERNEQTD